MSTHEPTAFPPPGINDSGNRGTRTALFALGGAGLAAAGLAAGLMLRPAPASAPVPQTVATAPTSAFVAPAPALQPATVQAPVAQAPAAPVPLAAVALPAAAAPAVAAVQPVPAHTQHQRHATVATAPQSTHGFTRHASTAPAYHARSNTGDAAPWREPTRQVAVCSNCGVVEGVRPVHTMAQGSGLGAIAGGVVGGLLGNQVGHGNGRTAMTVLGAVGGGVAGNEIEKRTRGETIYEVRVRMEDGTVRTLQQRTAPAPGSRVRVDGDTLRSNTAVGDQEPRYVRTGQSY